MIRKEPSFFVSLFPVLVLMGLLTLNIRYFESSASSGPNQIALLIAAIVTILSGALHLKISYEEMEKAMITSIGLSMQASLILLVVGSLIGVWILSGIVPTMVYYGLKMINPTWFLPVACISCCIVSLATGSSWSTSGTLGIALMGVGQAMGIPPGMIAGAIISGSYFGDKMSPLSDTTNLAPAMAGTDLFTHIRHMVYTTGPSIILALIGFVILGFYHQGQTMKADEIDSLLRVMEANFTISPWLFLVPGFVIFMVTRKVPALPALVGGALVGALTAIVAQPALLCKLAGVETLSFKAAYTEVMKTAFGGFSLDMGNKIVGDLFCRGGMASMLNTVWLIMTAMVFGGAMEVTGKLHRLAAAVLSMVRGTGSLIGATLATCIFMNITASDQYLAIVVPGRMFRAAYRRYGLHPKNLSRSLEDAGTVTSVLIPWNTCGAYYRGVLGVDTWTYLPYCFFNLLNPLVALIIGASGWTIERLPEEELEKDRLAAAEAQTKAL